MLTFRGFATFYKYLFNAIISVSIEQATSKMTLKISIEQKSENQQNGSFVESATDTENHEMPDDSDTGDTTSSDSEMSDDSDTKTTWDQATKYFILTLNNGKNDHSNKTSDSSESDDSCEDSSPNLENDMYAPDYDWFKNFTAEKIIQHKVDKSGKILYFVRWLDWAPEHDTWQSEKSFPPGFAMLHAYKSKHKLSKF